MNTAPTTIVTFRRLTATACLSLLALGGCAAETDTTRDVARESDHSHDTEARGPLTLDQCTGEQLDRQVTYDKVPDTIFTLDPQSAEFLIAMGLGDRIVGSWGMYTEEQLEQLPEYADELRAIEDFDDGKTWPPPIETIASTRPDIVVTTYRLNIPGYLDADRLKKDAGIDSYSFTSYCTGDTLRTFDPLYQDVENLGRIFDREDEAAALSAEIEGQVDEAAALSAGKERVTVWQYAGEKTPYPVGGTGIPNAIIYLGGGQNVFEDVDEVYGEVSWEQIAERNASVVWLQTDAGPGFIEAKDALLKATKGNPGIAAVEGVANERFLVLPYTTAGTLSVHNGEGVLEFARLLDELREE